MIQNEQLIEICVEIPRKSNIKYEFNLRKREMQIDRILHAPFSYPENYGFIPDTLDYDGDPLDIIVIGNYSVAPLTKLMIRVIGVLLFDDEGLVDNKIIGVLPSDPEFGLITDIKQISAHRLLSIRYFFQHYKDNENKRVLVKTFQGAEKADLLVTDSIRLYQKLKHEVSMLPKAELVNLLVKLQKKR